MQREYDRLEKEVLSHLNLSKSMTNLNKYSSESNQDLCSNSYFNICTSLIKLGEFQEKMEVKEGISSSNVEQKTDDNKLTDESVDQTLLFPTEYPEEGSITSVFNDSDDHDVVKSIKIYKKALRYCNKAISIEDHYYYRSNRALIFMKLNDKIKCAEDCLHVLNELQEFDPKTLESGLALTIVRKIIKDLKLDKQLS